LRYLTGVSGLASGGRLADSRYADVLVVQNYDEQRTGRLAELRAVLERGDIDLADFSLSSPLTSTGAERPGGAQEQDIGLVMLPSFSGGTLTQVDDAPLVRSPSDVWSRVPIV
jgi:hypothetical protein